MFRGFRATAGARGRVDYEFLWLTRRPMTAAFHGTREVLAFPSLLPAITAAAAAEVAAIVASRTARGQPEHKRVDQRRARVTSAIRKGHGVIEVAIRGSNHGYAVTKTLNLINELFVALHERHPEYLIAHFGISTE